MWPSWPSILQKNTPRKWARAYLKKAMELAGGNKSKAAEYLNLTLRSMRYRLDKAAIDT
ncbi:MAG: helix-turn-helix domain-containing protein [Desulfobacteraceae bacterium]|nr:helix-turn-helix domain-containing protein [Desulfobacteraceae bacterium]